MKNVNTQIVSYYTRLVINRMVADGVEYRLGIRNPFEHDAILAIY